MVAKRIARAGLVVALYLTITFILQPISFGPLQLRVAEALTVLPILYKETILALFLGVLIANILGGVGMVDIVAGSLITLLAAYLTYRLRKYFAAYLSPVILNGLLVSLYLHYLFGWPYWLTVLSVTAGQAIVIFGLGYPLIKILPKVRWNILKKDD